MRTGLALLSGIWLTLAPAGADALPLGLDLADTPDLVANALDVTYEALSNTLTVSGDVFEFDDGVGLPNPVKFGRFELSATVDAVGSLLGGTLTIEGKVINLGFKSGVLLTGTLSAFGFQPAGGDPFEFLLDVTGGDAAALYGPAAGMFMQATGFGGSFAGDFDNNGGVPGSGSGTADVRVPVPEPSAGLLLLLATGLALARRVGSKH